MLRTLNQVLIRDQLDVWNQLAEHYLAVSENYSSGIPKLKSCIYYKIKQFKLSKGKEKDLLNLTKRISYDQLQLSSPPTAQPTTPEQVDLDTGPAMPDCANSGPQLPTFYLHQETESFANVTSKVKALLKQGSKLRNIS